MKIMLFFKLTHPVYASDQDANNRNPILSWASHRIPGILCDICGPWSSSSRLRVPLPSVANEFIGVNFLSVKDWKEASDRWANLLKIDKTLLEPGAVIGQPMGKCIFTPTEDVVHPMPGQIWISDRVRKVFERENFSGVTFAEVYLTPKCETTSFSELVAQGRARRSISTINNIQICDVCGRRNFPSPNNLILDTTSWDRSDFFLLDNNPNILVVSKRVVDVLNSNGFSNVIATPIG
jgi:hypothetical protein